VAAEGAIVRDVAVASTVLSDPSAVNSPSFVAAWIVTYSRNTLRRPDAHAGPAALVFQILRLAADAGVRENLALRAEHGVPSTEA
jgi:hypothetical protein